MRHLRLTPKRYEFVNRIFLFALDVDELDSISKEVPIFARNEAGLYTFRDDDHFQIVPGGTARANAEAFLSSEGIEEKPARILLLTNARCFGYLFNPISIWYCQREDGSPLAAIAEVGNTFGELKPFLVPFHKGAFRLRTPKHFYVSPYSSVDLEFDFRFDRPGDRLVVCIDDYKGEDRTLISSLTGERAELTTSRLLAFTFKYPFITLQVITLIHWHAFLLWLKRVPFYRKENDIDLQKDVFRPHISLKKEQDEGNSVAGQGGG